MQDHVTAKGGTQEDKRLTHLKVGSSRIHGPEEQSEHEGMAKTLAPHGQHAGVYLQPLLVTGSVALQSDFSGLKAFQKGTLLAPSLYSCPRTTGSPGYMAA